MECGKYGYFASLNDIGISLVRKSIRKNLALHARNIIDNHELPVINEYDSKIFSNLLSYIFEKSKTYIIDTYNDNDNEGIIYWMVHLITII